MQAHQRLKITKDHTIKSKEDAAVDNQSASAEVKCLMCHIHPQEKLALFCETCDKLTCRDCQLVDHRDHKYKFAHEIASDTRTHLSSLLSEITYKRVLLNSAMKVIDDRQSQIAGKKKELVQDITNMVVRITNTVNMRGKQLAVRLNEVCDSKLKVLNEKKDALQLLSNHTDHCIDFVQSALDKGSDSAVLFSKKTLSRHLQKVKCQRADIPNPEIPVRIQVQLNQVPELQKVISQLGTIIVDGKAYPPVMSPGPSRQQPSPNLMPAGGAHAPLQSSPLGPVVHAAMQQAQAQQQPSQQQQQQQQPPTPQQQQQQQAIQQQPIQQQPPQQTQRAGMQPPGISPQPNAINNASVAAAFMFNSTSPLAQPPQGQPPGFGPSMNRSFSQDGSAQSGNANNFSPFVSSMASMRTGAPHVSSSTHPQNLGEYFLSICYLSLHRTE